MQVKEKTVKTFILTQNHVVPSFIQVYFPFLQIGEFIPKSCSSLSNFQKKCIHFKQEQTNHTSFRDIHSLSVDIRFPNLLEVLTKAQKLLFFLLECIKDACMCTCVHTHTLLHLEIIFLLQAVEESLPYRTTKLISLGIRRCFTGLGAQNFKAMSLYKQCNNKLFSRCEI